MFDIFRNIAGPEEESPPRPFFVYVLIHYSMAKTVLRRGVNHALEKVGKEPVRTLSRYYPAICSQRLRKAVVKVAEDLAEVKKEANTVTCRTLANMTSSLVPNAAEFLFDLCLLHVPLLWVHKPRTLGFGDDYNLYVVPNF